jgi:hypothetical protein
MDNEKAKLDLTHISKKLKKLKRMFSKINNVNIKSNLFSLANHRQKQKSSHNLAYGFSNDVKQLCEI